MINIVRKEAGFLGAWSSTSQGHTHNAFANILALLCCQATWLVP